MKVLAVRFGRLARGLMLLGVLLLIAGPGLPAAAAQPKDDCCPEASCHGENGKAICPPLCVLACQAIVAPDPLISHPAGLAPVAVTRMATMLPNGQTPAPELPPPR